MQRKLILFLACWATAAVVAVIVLATLKPTGPMRWVLWAVAIVPTGVLANVIFEGIARLFMSLPGMRHGTEYFENRAQGKEFSALRAGWYAFAAILGFVVVVAISGAAWSAYETIWDFIAQDKCLDQGGRWEATTKACEH
jgi:hypothetical protein